MGLEIYNIPCIHSLKLVPICHYVANVVAAAPPLCIIKCRGIGKTFDGGHSCRVDLAQTENFGGGDMCPQCWLESLPESLSLSFPFLSFSVTLTWI